jgi:hypothetical protein
MVPDDRSRLPVRSSTSGWNCRASPFSYADHSFTRRGASAHLQMFVDAKEKFRIPAKANIILRSLPVQKVPQFRAAVQPYPKLTQRSLMDGFGFKAVPCNPPDHQTTSDGEKTMLELYHGYTSVCAQKARPSYGSAITKWLRPQDIVRYEKIADPWADVSKNLGQ